MKTIVKILLAIGLVVLEIYLIFSFVGGNIAEKKRVERICDNKCSYDSNSYLWEFSSDTITRGFTTKSECFSFCLKKEQGFAAILKDYGSAFLGAIFSRTK